MVVFCARCAVSIFGQLTVRLGSPVLKIHHTKPLFQYEDEDQILFLQEAVSRVSPLCSNCHRIIHRYRNRLIDVEDLRDLVLRNRR